VSTRSERPADQAGDALYRERLRTPIWWYAVALGVAALLAAEFHISKYALTDWIPYSVLLPGALAVVWSIGHSSLEIKGGEVHIRGAHVPMTEISGAIALDPKTLKLVVGREGDPAAFVSIRPWVGPGVQLWLDDPDDPTPYWIVSSRNPQAVVDIVRAQSGR
jgi:hypothetical protein